MTLGIKSLKTAAVSTSHLPEPFHVEKWGRRDSDCEQAADRIKKRNIYKINTKFILIFLRPQIHPPKKLWHCDERAGLREQEPPPQSNHPRKSRLLDPDGVLLSAHCPSCHHILFNVSSSLRVIVLTIMQTNKVIITIPYVQKLNRLTPYHVCKLTQNVMFHPGRQWSTQISG